MLKKIIVIIFLFRLCFYSQIGIKMVAIFLLISAFLFTSVHSYGFDGGASCSEKTSRKGKAELIRTIPCDLSTQAYCNLPGNAYPWNAVRRFVHENQGLMKRMYGDVRHISVLRDEINNNDIDDDDVQEATVRYSRTAWKRNKNLHENGSKGRKNVGEENARRMPIRRSTTTTSTTSTTMKSTNLDTIRTEATTKSLPMGKKKSNRNESDTSDGTELEKELVATVEEIFVQLQDDSGDTNIRMQEPNATSAYETFNESEIEVNEKKDVSILAINKTEAATISTTLRIFGKNKNKEPEIISTTTMTTPTTSITTTTTTDKLKFENEKTNMTLKVLNENIIHDDADNNNTDNTRDDADELDGNVENDSHSSDSIHSQTIVDLNGKPAGVNGVAQLFQDVAEKEDPIFANSRGV